MRQTFLFSFLAHAQLARLQCVVLTVTNFACELFCRYGRITKFTSHRPTQTLAATNHGQQSKIQTERELHGTQLRCCFLVYENCISIVFLICHRSYLPKQHNSRCGGKANKWWLGFFLVYFLRLVPLLP